MKKNKKKLKKLTKADEAVIERKMLYAALNAFGEFPKRTEDEDQDEFARRVIHAFSITEEVRKTEVRYFDEDVSIDATIDIVATAFYIWSEDHDCNLNDYAPRSVIAGRYLGFAQGLAALKAMSDAVDVLRDDGGYFMFTPYEAHHLDKIISIESKKEGF